MSRPLTVVPVLAVSMLAAASATAQTLPLWEAGVVAGAVIGGGVRWTLGRSEKDAVSAQ